MEPRARFKYRFKLSGFEFFFWFGRLAFCGRARAKLKPIFPNQDPLEVIKKVEDISDWFVLGKWKRESAYGFKDEPLMQNKRGRYDQTGSLGIVSLFTLRSDERH